MQNITGWYLSFVMSSVALCMTNEVNSDQSVRHCPSSPIEWKTRADQVQCKGDIGVVYHCINALEIGLVELCMIPYSLNPADGCPVIDSKRVLHFNQCQNRQKKCPQPNDDYYSTYELFKYPGCYMEFEIDVTPLSSNVFTVNEHSSSFPLFLQSDIGLRNLVESTSSEDKATTEGKDYVYLKSTKTFRGNSDKDEIFQPKFYTGILVGGSAIVICLLLSIVIYLLCRNRKYREEVYFFKYHTNIDTRRQDPDVYSEIKETNSPVLTRAHGNTNTDTSFAFDIASVTTKSNDNFRFSRAASMTDLKFLGSEHLQSDTCSYLSPSTSTTLPQSDCQDHKSMYQTALKSSISSRKGKIFAEKGQVPSRTKHSPHGLSREPKCHSV